MSTNACRGAQQKKEEYMNRCILAVLRKSETYRGIAAAANRSGLCLKYYKKKRENNPESFTIGQIRDILPDEISNEEILAMFGRKG